MRYTQSSRPPCESKAELRERKKKELAALSNEYIKSSDSEIERRLLGMPEYRNAETVFAYYSVGLEPATHAIIAKALSQGKKVALPACSNGGMMQFKQIGSIDELIKGRFGICEPCESCKEIKPKKNDIIIVPALCADRHKNRLGHGAGYYDRYLSTAEGISVCLCRARLIEDELPTEPTDVKVSIVLTD